MRSPSISSRSLRTLPPPVTSAVESPARAANSQKRRGATTPEARATRAPTTVPTKDTPRLPPRTSRSAGITGGDGRALSITVVSEVPQLFFRERDAGARRRSDRGRTAVNGFEPTSWAVRELRTRGEEGLARLRGSDSSTYIWGAAAWHRVQLLDQGAFVRPHCPRFQTGREVRLRAWGYPRPSSHEAARRHWVARQGLPHEEPSRGSGRGAPRGDVRRERAGGRFVSGRRGCRQWRLGPCRSRSVRSRSGRGAAASGQRLRNVAVPGRGGRWPGRGPAEGEVNAAPAAGAPGAG